MYVTRDQKIWQDAETFDPTRFLRDVTLKTKPEGYLPFSARRRVCLGKSMAKSELFLMCTSLLQKLELRLPQRVQYNFKSLCKITKKDIKLLSRYCNLFSIGYIVGQEMVCAASATF